MQRKEIHEYIFLISGNEWSVIEWASETCCFLAVVGKFIKVLYNIIKPWGLYVTSSDRYSCFQPKNPALQGNDGTVNVNIFVCFITLGTLTWWAVLLQSGAAHVNVLWHCSALLHCDWSFILWRSFLYLKCWYNWSMKWVIKTKQI